jgi:hypothetical protein
MALLATVFALLSASPETFAITYERSGGLKPMPYRLAIRPGLQGSLTTRGTLDERSRTVRFPVGKKKLRALQGALERADFETVGTPGPNPGVCADCFFYSIVYEGHEVTFSQIEVPERLRETVHLLEKLVAAHRPRH